MPRPRPDSTRRRKRPLSMRTERGRASLARRHAESLATHLEAMGYRGEARAALTVVEILDGRWLHLP
jgi:hypothetical protein